MTTAHELAWLAAHEIADLIRNGELTAAELIDHTLDRIDAVDPAIHSFLTVAPEFARDQAAALDDIPIDQRTGPLCGVPFAAKDNIFTSQVRTTLGSRLFQAFRPDIDARVIERSQAAQGILVGKTNLPEFSMWVRTRNLVSAECRNPWETRRTSGASSGGSGAAVAAGLVPLAIGSDDGGSIRLPAALNGVFGFFPSPGRVPMDGCVIGHRVSAVGPLTRSVRDAALFLDAVHPGHFFARELDRSVSGVRCAWLADHESVEITDGRVVAAVRDAAQALCGSGVQVEAVNDRLIDAVDAEMRPPDPALTRYGGVFVSELPELGEIQRHDPRWQDQLAPTTNPARVTGSALAAPLSDAAKRRRQAVVGQIMGLLDHYDFLLTPTIDQVAPLVTDEWRYPYGPANAAAHNAIRHYTKYTLRVNLAGCPAASVPCGFVDGMPIGLQIIGRPGDDLGVLRMSRAFERIVPWASHYPAMPQ